MDGSIANCSNTKSVKVPPFNANDIIKKEQQTKAKTKRTKAELSKAQDKILAQLNLDEEPVNNKLYNNLQQCKQASRIRSERYTRTNRVQDTYIDETLYPTKRDLYRLQQVDLKPLR